MKGSKKSIIAALVLAASALVFYLGATGRFGDRLGSRYYPTKQKTVSYFCREGVISATNSAEHANFGNLNETTSYRTKRGNSFSIFISLS